MIGTRYLTDHIPFLVVSCSVRRLEHAHPTSYLLQVAWCFVKELAFPYLLIGKLKFSLRPVLSPFISHGSLQSQVTIFCMKVAKCSTGFSCFDL